MTEDDARAWIADRFDAESVARVERFVDAVAAESTAQNLIARSTLPTIWARHVIDSAQLIRLSANPDGAWLDIGTGAGFPGMVVALLTGAPMTLVEPRRKRADFLATAAADHPRITVAAARVETVRGAPADTITARAVASASEIFTMTRHLCGKHTRYLLPRGRSIGEELENARSGWHGMFHVEPSMTDPDSGILVASNVRPR